MILHTQPGEPWNDHDFLLIEAYQILENERCSQCGLPRYVCHNESNDIRFEIEEDTCEAKVEIDMYEKRNSQNSDYEVPSGTVMVPQVFTTSGVDLSSFRLPYYEALHAKRQIIEESRLRPS